MFLPPAPMVLVLLPASAPCCVPEDAVRDVMFGTPTSPDKIGRWAASGINKRRPAPVAFPFAGA
jgi:hypothetical protein